MKTDFFDGRARLIPLRGHGDARGLLLPFDFATLPFTPCRIFTVSQVPTGTVRGAHGHKSGEQLLVCLQGRIDILMRHLDEAETLTLSPSSHGLLVGAGVWCQQTYLTWETVLMVFASQPYDPQSYLTDWR